MRRHEDLPAAPAPEPYIRYSISGTRDFEGSQAIELSLQGQGILVTREVVTHEVSSDKISCTIIHESIDADLCSD